MSVDSRIHETVEFAVNRIEWAEHSVVLSYKWRWNVKSCYLCQDSLVVWVSVRAGAGLAVLRSANNGVTKEARSALITEPPLGVVQAALEGGTYRV